MISKQAVLDVLKNYGLDDLDTGYLTSIINALPSISDGWISVEDRDALLGIDDGQELNILLNDGRVKISTFRFGSGRNGFYCGSSTSMSFGIEHIKGWQPLPPAPSK